MINIDDNEGEDEVGRLYFLKVDVERGARHRYSINDLLDSHSSDANFFGAAILDDETGDFSEEVLESLGVVYVSKILIIHVCAICPDKRGRALGRKFVTRAIEMLGDDCQLILCHPKQIESDTIDNGNLPSNWLLEKGPDDEGLRTYWSKLGLTRVNDSNVYACGN